MGQVLDAILRDELIGDRDSNTPVVIDTTGTSIGTDASGSEQGYIVGIQYQNGVGPVDISFSVEGSIDGVNYGEIPDTSVQILDTSGNITYDIINSNANFIRIAYTVTSGNIEVFAQFSAKRRH